MNRRQFLSGVYSAPLAVSAVALAAVLPIPKKKRVSIKDITVKINIDEFARDMEKAGGLVNA